MRVKFLLILALSLNFSIVASTQAVLQPPSCKLPFLPVRAEPQPSQEAGPQRDVTIPNTSVSDVSPLSPPSHTAPISPAATGTCNMEAESGKHIAEERVDEMVVEEEKKANVEEESRKKPFWLDDDDLPPMM